MKNAESKTKWIVIDMGEVQELKELPREMKDNPDWYEVAEPVAKMITSLQDKDLKNKERITLLKFISDALDKGNIIEKDGGIHNEIKRKLKN